MIDLAVTPSASLHALLSEHPKVADVQYLPEPDRPAIAFRQGNWEREVWIGRPDLELAGLVEIEDNNPLVCGDHFSVPGPSATVALIALAPLAIAGLISEPPVLLANVPGEEVALNRFLERLGYGGGHQWLAEEVSLPGIVAVNALVRVPTPDDLADLDALFEERYSRSFYVRREETGDWDTAAVRGRPWAQYRLRITPDEPFSLLRVQVMADARGKAGDAQALHALNVMAGFEESLGIPDAWEV